MWISVAALLMSVASLAISFWHNRKSAITGRKPVLTLVELRKTGANQYDVVADERVIRQVWNWHGSWSAEGSGETHHALKSRKEAIAKVEHIYRAKR